LSNAPIVAPREESPDRNRSEDQGGFRGQLDYINSDLRQKQRDWDRAQEKIDDLYRLSSSAESPLSHGECPGIWEKLHRIDAHLTRCHKEMREMRSGIQAVYQNCERPRCANHLTSSPTVGVAAVVGSWSTIVGRHREALVWTLGIGAGLLALGHLLNQVEIVLEKND
jgi:hypothetical protein